jgi:hypothetical protein
LLSFIPLFPFFSSSFFFFLFLPERLEESFSSFVFSDSDDQVKRMSESLHYHFRGNLCSVLAFAYPEFDWAALFLSRKGSKKWARQRELVTLVRAMLPHGAEVVENYLHPDLKWGLHRIVDRVFPLFFFFFLRCFFSIVI